MLKALESLASRVRGGQRLRLLCHCRPHVGARAAVGRSHEARWVELLWEGAREGVKSEALS